MTFLFEESVAGERVLEHVDFSRPGEGLRELVLQGVEVVHNTAQGRISQSKMLGF